MTFTFLRLFFRRYAFLFCMCITVVIPISIYIYSSMPTDTIGRNMRLPEFDPHRPTFTCLHEVAVSPPLDPQAEALYLQAERHASYADKIDGPDFAAAAKLYRQAADKKHWRAQLKLADLYMDGIGVEGDSDMAIKLVEEMMRLGVPAAYYQMGIYSYSDMPRKFAFLQKAADMGNPRAMTFLGDRLTASKETEERGDLPGYWGNPEIGIKMLECAVEQGYGPAAYEVSFIYGRSNTPKDNRMTIEVLHQGVKLGNEECADSLFVLFNGEGLTTGTNAAPLDKERARRYSAIGDYFARHDEFPLPNLDKVLPLPPAKLPQWDGKKESLINAAKAVVPIPPQPVSQESQRKGRYHLPPQYRFAGGEQHYQWKEPQHSPYSHSARVAPYEGYWLPNIPTSHHEHVIQSLLAVQPGLYKAGEAFDPVPNLYFPQYGCPGTTWRCVVVERVPDKRNPRVKAGLAREVVVPKPTITARIGAAAPQSGYWLATLPKDHPHATIYTQHYPHQGYFAQGEQLPAPHDVQLLGINPRDVTWQLTEQSEPERLFGIG